MKYNDAELNTPDSIIEGFAKYFNDVYKISNSNSTLPNVNINSSVFVNITHMSENDIFLALKNCKNSLTMGHDGIPSFLLRDCACIFVKPCYRIFNLILKCSIFPDIWKKAIICPVFKKGDVTDITNYRPISLLCNFAKVFESVMYI